MIERPRGTGSGIGRDPSDFELMVEWLVMLVGFLAFVGALCWHVARGG